MIASLVDRLIAVVSPSAALRRAGYRAALEELSRRHYDAARPVAGSSWILQPGGPAETVLEHLEALRDRARDLVRNNAWARRAVQVLVSETVGDGIVPEPVGLDEQLAQQLKRLWSRWSRAVDLSGKLTFEAAQSLAFRSVVEAGEVLIRRVVDPSADGVPLRLQVLEPDYLPHDLSEPARRIVGGIEHDARGVPVAYHLYTQHPRDNVAPRSETTRVLADDIIHAFQIDRPGQPRGVTWLAPVIIALRDLYELERAELVKSKVEACLTAAVERADAALTPLGQVEDGDREALETFRPGMVAYLKPGETVKFLDPSKKTDFGPYVLHVLLKIAAGIGLTYDQLTGDLRQANYSSLRAGKIVFRRLVTQWQYQLIVPQICEPIWRWFIDAAIVSGQLPPGDYEVEWVAPGHEPIDPLKDAKAEIALIRAGLKPLSRAIAERGDSPDVILSEYARVAAELDRLGLVLDTDPRRDARRGAGDLADGDADAD